MTDLDIETRLQRAWSERREGRLDKAASIYDELLALQHGDLKPADRRRALSGRAQVHRDEGEVSQALRCLNEAVQLARTVCDPGPLAHALRHAAEARLEIVPPDSENATALAQEALELLQSQSTEGLALANAWRGVALARRANGELDRAAEAWERAAAQYEAAGVEPGVEEARAQLVSLAGASS